MPVVSWLAGRLCQSCLHAYDEDSNGRCSEAEQHLFPKVFHVNNLSFLRVRFPREVLCDLKPSYRGPCSKINTQLYEEKSGVTHLFNTYLLNTHCIQALILGPVIQHRMSSVKFLLQRAWYSSDLVFFWEVGRACGTWSQTFLLFIYCYCKLNHALPPLSSFKPPFFICKVEPMRDSGLKWFKHLAQGRDAIIWLQIAFQVALKGLTLVMLPSAEGAMRATVPPLPL